MSTKRFRPDAPLSLSELRRRVDARTVTCGICQQKPAVAVLSAELRADKKAELMTMCVCDDCYDDARAGLTATLGGSDAELTEAVIQGQDSRWFGYDTSIGTEPYVFLPNHGLVCTGRLITPNLLFEDRSLDGTDFKVGDWQVAIWENDQPESLHGPFPTVESSIDFGRKNTVAVRFLTAPTEGGFE